MGNSLRHKPENNNPRPVTISFTLWPDQVNRLAQNRALNGQSSSDVARKAFDKLWKINRDAQGNVVK